ncbi:MAG: ANTAR domain-containing protein [Comamonas sp.]
MSMTVLKELRELKVVIVHPPDEEGSALQAHLRRIGCMASFAWPLPEALPANADVVFVLIDDHFRPGCRKLLQALPQPRPTVIAIQSYEDPGTLQVMLDMGALASVQKPIRASGLLASLAIARKTWADAQALCKENRKLRRKIVSDQTISRAKAILMAARDIDEQGAYDAIRAQAMARRVSMNEIANSIINMEKLLKLD